MNLVILATYLGILSLHQCYALVPNCTHNIDGVLIDNPDKPEDFFICIGGKAVAMSCSTGYVYCSIYMACAPSCNEAIATTIASTVKTTEVSKTTIGTTTTTKVTTTTTTAPTKTTEKTTVLPTEGPVTVVPTNCNGQKDGYIYGLPGKCSDYVICVNNSQVLGQCTGKLKFDSVKGVCSTEKCP